MASMRNIKRRIRSVASTQQITKAMNLVAASKLQKAKQKLERTRPFYTETRNVIQSIISSSKGLKNPYLVQREVKSTAYIVMTGDRGLCGGYNTNVSKLAYTMMKGKPNEKVIAIGVKARDFFRRRKKNIHKLYVGMSEKPFYEDAKEIGRLVFELYDSGQVDEVYLVYTEFKSTISHEPKAMKLLPIDPEEILAGSDSAGSAQLMNYEPDEDTLLSYMVPKYVDTLIFGAMVESSACEQGARMTSMDSATKNSSDLIEKYTLQYNRARQGAITQEINEIVSGANALQ